MISYQYCIICHQILYILSQYGPLVPGWTASVHCCDLLTLLLQIIWWLARNWEQIWHSDIPFLKWQLFTNETKYFKEFENVEWWILLLSSLLVVRTRVSEESHGFHCLPFRSDLFQARILVVTVLAYLYFLCVVLCLPFLFLLDFFSVLLFTALRLRIVLLLSSNCSVPQVYRKSRISDRGSPLDGWFSGCNTDRLAVTIFGNVFGECHDPCMQIYLYCRFRHCSRYKKLNFSSLPKSPYFQWESNNVEPITHLFPHFDIVFI